MNSQIHEHSKIYVKMTKTVAIDVHSTSTVGDIKSKFSAIEGIDKSQQELFFAGLHLQNDRRLADYNIPMNSSIDLYVVDRMQICIKIPSIAKSLMLNLMKSSTVADVKARIQDSEGILWHKQVLMYSSRQLDDNEKLSACGIRNGETIHVVVRPTDELRIFVNVMNERTVSLDVRCWYTVSDIKLMIESLEDVPAHRQMLFLSDKQLMDVQTLQDQHVEDNCILKLQQFVQVFIRTWEGKTLMMSLEMSDVVAEVKNKIKAKLQSKDNLDYYLCYRGRVLQDESMLFMYNIENDSTVDVRLRSSSYVKPQK